MTALNVRNRTLAIMDNLDFLRSLNNECVDLIAIDPPFAMNETFTRRPKPPITEAELAEEKELAALHGVVHNEGIGETRVKDHWNWDDDVNPAWKLTIQEDYPKVHAVIEAVEACASENEAAYISFMAARLLHCWRVLKPTGSIYIHCNNKANGYLRMLLDAIFGAGHFRSQLIWNRSGGKSDAKRWGPVTDHILHFSKSNKFTWNPQYQPHDPEYVAKTYKQDDGDGRGSYTTMPLHAAGLRIAESGLPWNGYDPGAKGRHWATPTKGVMHQYIIENNLIPGWPESYPNVHDRLYALHAVGLITAPKNKQSLPRLKTYLAATRGVAATDLIVDIPMASGSEDTGYATQKPLELYERVIRASSNPGDVVLDIFAGCATTAVAAERLGRQWVACDMAYRSWTMLKRRFAIHGFALSDMTQATVDALHGKQPELSGAKSYTIGPNQVPDRYDDDPRHIAYLARPRKRQTTQTSSWSGRIPKDEAKQLLIDKFGPYCWGCGWEAPRFPNGERDLGLLEVDHIWARKEVNTQGGSDELYNLALLHATCNRRKGNRMTLEQLRQLNIDDQRIYGEVADLVHLGEAMQYATETILQRGVQTVLV